MNGVPQESPGTHVKEMLRYRYLIFAVIAVAYFLVYFHRTSTAVVGSELLREFSMAPAALGLLGSMYFYSYAAGQLPAGILADSWGARKTISVFIGIAALGSILFGFATNFDMLMMGRFLVGLGVGFVYVPAMRILTDWFRPNEFATYSGILLAVGNIGSLSSAAPLVVLMGAIGWRSSFYLIGAVSVAAAVLAYFIIRNKPNELGFPTPRELDGLPAAPPVQKFGIAESLKIVMSNSQFYLIAILLFSFYGTMMGFQGLWAGPYLQHVYGLTKAQAGNLLMLIPLGFVFGCPLAGYISDKVLKSRKKVLLYGCILYTLSYIPLVFWIDQLSINFISALFFYYGLIGGTFVVCFACVKETFVPQLAGTAVGALNLFIFTGGALYQQVMGAIIGSYPQIAPGIYGIAAYKTAFTLCLVGCIVGILFYAFFKENPKT